VQVGARSSLREAGRTAGGVTSEQALRVLSTYMLCGRTPGGSSWCPQSSRPRTGTSNLLSRRAPPPAAGRPRSSPPAPASLEEERGTASAQEEHLGGGKLRQHLRRLVDAQSSRAEAGGWRHLRGIQVWHLCKSQSFIWRVTRS